MHRTTRILLSLVMLALVTTRNAVHPTTASKGADIVGVPPHAALFTLPAKPPQPLLRPDDGVTYLAANATLPCGRFVASSMSAGHRITRAKPALLCWHTHLPRSQAGEPPPDIGFPPRTTFA